MRAKQLEKLLTFAFSNNFPVLIKGKPGIGKSDIVEQSTMKCIHTDGKPYDLLIVHPVVQDPTEPGGIPWVVNGEVHKLPFENLRRMLTATRPLVVFIDDLGQAAISVQAAYMQLLLLRQIDGQPISPFVIFVAATNRKEDMAGVAGILEPVKSRFSCIVELEYNTEDWCSWAYLNNMPGELVSFNQWRPELIEAAKLSKDIVNSPAPRTVAYVGKMYNAGLPAEIEYETIKGAVGEVYTIEFMAYKKIFATLPTTTEIEMNPTGVRVPYNVSEQFALMGNITTAITPRNIDSFATYLRRMPEEMMAAAMKNASVKTPEIMSTGAFAQWGIKNAQYVL